MINISLLQGRSINIEVLEDNLLSFMFYVGMSLMPLLIYFMLGSRFQITNNIKNSKLLSLQIVLAFLIPILFYYNIYFKLYKITEFLYAISTFVYSINFMILYAKLFYPKNNSNEIVSNLTESN